MQRCEESVLNESLKSSRLCLFQVEENTVASWFEK